MRSNKCCVWTSVWGMNGKDACNPEARRSPKYLGLGGNDVEKRVCHDTHDLGRKRKWTLVNVTGGCRQPINGECLRFGTILMSTHSQTGIKWVPRHSSRSPTDGSHRNRELLHWNAPVTQNRKRSVTLLIPKRYASRLIWEQFEDQTHPRRVAVMAQKTQSLFFVSIFAKRKLDPISTGSKDGKSPQTRILAEYLPQDAGSKEEIMNENQLAAVMDVTKKRHFLQRQWRTSWKLRFLPIW